MVVVEMLQQPMLQVRRIMVPTYNVIQEQQATPLSQISDLLLLGRVVDNTVEMPVRRVPLVGLHSVHILPLHAQLFPNNLVLLLLVPILSISQLRAHYKCK